MHNRGENFSLKNFYLFKIGAVRPLCVVRITSVAFPITARRDEEFAEFFKDCKQSLSRPTEVHYRLWFGKHPQSLCALVSKIVYKAVDVGKVVFAVSIEVDVGKYKLGYFNIGKGRK